MKILFLEGTPFSLKRHDKRCLKENFLSLMKNGNLMEYTWTTVQFIRRKVTKMGVNYFTTKNLL